MLMMSFVCWKEVVSRLMPGEKAIGMVLEIAGGLMAFPFILVCGNARGTR